MNKQPISVTLSPDNLLWLKGRSRAVAAGSLSEFLDRIITRARCGQDTPRPFRSMKGALASTDLEPDFDAPGVSAEFWQVRQEKWDDLLAGLDDAPRTVPAVHAKVGRLRQPSAVAEKAPAYGRRRSGRG
jgi:hypothetical protein